MSQKPSPMKISVRRGTLLASLEHAKGKLELYTNRKKKNGLLNRFAKLAHAPTKVARIALYRVGLLPLENVHARMFWGGTLTLPMWDEDAVIAYYTGSFGAAELPLVAYLVRTLDGESVFYDIGSNLGLYAALAEALGATVHSFEPNPRTTKYLKVNSRDGSTVNVLALSDKKGTIPFFEVSVGRKIGMSSMFPDVVPQTVDKKPSVMEVEALPLDEYVANHAQPTVLKIDVMNAEYLVLGGARSFLEASNPILAIRLYRNPQALERTHETLSLLAELGYEAHSIGDDGTINPVGIVLEEIPFVSTFIFKKS